MIDSIIFDWFLSLELFCLDHRTLCLILQETAKYDHDLNSNFLETLIGNFPGLLTFTFGRLIHDLQF